MRSVALVRNLSPYRAPPPKETDSRRVRPAVTAFDVANENKLKFHLDRSRCERAIGTRGSDGEAR